MKTMMARPWNLDYSWDNKKHPISPLEVIFHAFGTPM
jgi:hypothetical protein